MNGNQARALIHSKKPRAYWAVVYVHEDDKRLRMIEISRSSALAILSMVGPEEANVYMRLHPDGEEMVIGKHPGGGRT